MRFTMTVLHITILIISFIGWKLSAASDVTWALSDDSFLPDSFLDQATADANDDVSLFNLATVPAGLDNPSFSLDDSLLDFPPLEDKDIDSLPFEDTSIDGTNLLSFDDTVADDQLELADCSATSELSVIGKSRVRRLDGSPLTCSQRDEELSPETREKLKRTFRILVRPDLLQEFSPARGSEDQNTACWVATMGELPWGMCSTGAISDQRPMYTYEMTPEQMINYQQFSVRVLYSAFVGTLIDIQARERAKSSKVNDD